MQTFHQQDVGQDDAGDQLYLPSDRDSTRPLRLSSSSLMHSPLPKGVRDLSNTKLAQNQTELSKQIVDLSRMVEEQGQLLRRVMKVLEGENSNLGKGKEREGECIAYSSGYQY